MDFKRILAALFLMLAVPCLMAEEASGTSAPTDQADKPAAETDAHGGHGDDHHEGGSHGLPPHAPVIFGPEGVVKVGPLQITNSMFVTWVVALGIILVVQIAMRNVALIPDGLQNLVECIVEGLYDFFESIVGDHMINRTFWFLATVFVFILTANWFGLVPGLGTIGWAEPGHHNEHITEPLMRGVNADLNMTLGMAAIFMLLWVYWSLTEQGIGGFLGHIFAVKGHGGGFLGVFLVLVFVFVGLIEVVSIGVRPVALTFRLYGNVYAGENILESVIMLGNQVLMYVGGALAVLPFYFLEILVGLVQALVFALLCGVFTALMCEKHEGHAH